jgi:hypothetical protein
LPPLSSKLAAIRETGPIQLAQRLAVSFLVVRTEPMHALTLAGSTQDDSD